MSNALTATLERRLAEVRRRALRPPPKLNLVQWADRHRYLSREASALPGKWSTSHVEVARGPMMAYSQPAVHTLTVMCCTQLLKTELMLNITGYHMHQDPAPIIVMQPTVSMGEAFSKDRVDPMLRDSPALSEHVPKKKSREGGNTILHKQFPGGQLTIIGANAPGELAMRPVRIVLRDEVDKYPEDVGGEGDPLAIIAERAATFWNHKIVNACSPTVEGRSRIAREYESGDQRVFEPPCPHCGHREEMRWEMVRWPEGKPEEAMYHCPGCGAGWSEPERQRALKAAGKLPEFIDENGCHHGYGWRATKPFNGHASFRASKLASPWEPMPKLAEKWVKAQSDVQLLKAFMNTQLAETWKEKGEAPEWQRLYDRRELYGRNVVPLGGVLLTAGVDVQKDRIEVELVAWGRRMQTWSIDYRVFMGDTADPDGPESPWRQLDAMLAEQWEHESGVFMQLRVMAVDTGYNTQTVYNWCRKYPNNRVMAIKGDEHGATLIGQPKPVDVMRNGKRIARGLKLWHIALDIAKSELYGWLRQDRPSEDDTLLPVGWARFPEYGEEYFRQLTAEQLVSKVVRGYRRWQWEKTRERNEALDCRVYARAAAAMAGIDRWKEPQWAELERSLGKVQMQEQPKGEGGAAAQAQPESRGMQRRKSSWL